MNNDEFRERYWEWGMGNGEWKATSQFKIKIIVAIIQYCNQMFYLIMPFIYLIF